MHNTSLNHISEHVERVQNFELNSPSNFSTILNVPQRSSGVFQQLYSALQNSILENPYFLNLIKQPVEQTKVITVQEASDIMNQLYQQSNYDNVLNVDEQEFHHYIGKIQKVYLEYLKMTSKKNNQFDPTKSIQLQDHTIDLDQMVVQCYSSVPNVFFEEKFHLNFEILSKSLPVINEYQEELTNYLDEVDINLFYQINSRFDQFLSVILNLNEIREIITINQETVSKLRKTYQRSKKDFTNKSIEIIRKKKQTEQLESVLQTLRLVQTTQKTCNNLMEMIKNQKFEQSLKLLKVTEQTYNSNMKSIDALSYMPQKFTSIANSIQQALTTNLIFAYNSSLIQQLSPFKQLQTQLNVLIQDQSQPDEVNNNIGNSFLANDSWYDQGASGTGLTVILSKDENNDQKDRSQIARMIVQAIDLVDLTSRVFKNKLLDELKAYFTDFISNLVEFLSQRSNQSPQSQPLSIDVDLQKGQSESAELEYLEEVMPKLSIQVYVKISMFFCDSIQRVLKNQLLINDTSIQMILHHLNDRLNKSDQQSHQMIIDKYLEIVEELHSIPVSILKYAYEKISIILGLSRLSGENLVKDFKDVIGIFQSWDKFYQEDMKRIIFVEYAKQDESLQIHLQKFQLKGIQSYQKCSLNQLQYLRTETEKAYLNWFNRNRIQKLRKALEDDTWTPADIYFDYYEILFYIFRMKQENLEQQDYSQMQESMLDESLLMNNSVIQEKGGKAQFNTLLQLVHNDVFKIVKNELFMTQDNQKFKLTNAFLIYLTTLHDYANIFETFQSVSNDHLSKFYEIIKLYNSYSTQLILGAGGIHFGKMKTIAAKNLAISSLCLRFFLKILPPLQQRISDLLSTEQQKSQYIIEIAKIQADYQNHNQEILNKMATLLQERFSEQCQEIGQLNWNDAQSKLTTPSKFTASMLNSTRQMYIAVEDLFLSDDLKYVFSRILQLLKEDFLASFDGLNINSKLGATRVKEELEYMRSSLYDIGKLKTLLEDQLADLDEEIDGIIHKKCYQLLKVKLESSKSE